MPSISQRFRNSWVPKELSSTVLPQLLFTSFLRSDCGPLPSIQWYSSPKQPPGQRSTGTFRALKASSTSVRYPFTFGMEESLPTQMPS